MFARKLRVNVILDGESKPCPLEWLDKFLMRNFTGAAEFDDALPVSDGHVEAGLRLSPPRLAQALQHWLVQTGKISGQTSVEVAVENPSNGQE